MYIYASNECVDATPAKTAPLLGGLVQSKDADHTPGYDGKASSKARFSSTSLSSRVGDGIRIFDTQVHLPRSSARSFDFKRARKWSRPSMGARDRKERKTSLRIISGESRIEDMVCGVGEGADATVCRISPIWNTVSKNGHNGVWETRLTWQVTAVQGREPMKEPRRQSSKATPVTPHAMLMPDQGTTPIRRRMERRIHGDVWEACCSDFVPSRADRVRSRALGKK